IGGDILDILALQAPNVGSFGSAQVCSRLYKGLKYLFQIERRATDDLQHVGGRCLTFERLLQLAFARLLSLKQSRVLDCDYGLVGEGLEQTDLLFSERSHFGAADANGADRFTLLPLQWNSQRSSEAIPDRHRLAARKIRPGCS